MDRVLNNVKRLKNSKTGDLKHLYRNELDKACFDNDVAISDSKDLAKRTISDKILKDRAYEIATNPKYEGYQRRLAKMVYRFFDKKTELGASVNEELAQELQKQVIKNSRKGESMIVLKITFGKQT